MSSTPSKSDECDSESNSCFETWPQRAVDMLWKWRQNLEVFYQLSSAFDAGPLSHYQSGIQNSMNLQQNCKKAPTEPLEVVTKARDVPFHFGRHWAQFKHLWPVKTAWDNPQYLAARPNTTFEQLSQTCSAIIRFTRPVSYVACRWVSSLYCLLHGAPTPCILKKWKRLQAANAADLLLLIPCWYLIPKVVPILLAGTPHNEKCFNCTWKSYNSPHAFSFVYIPVHWRISVTKKKRGGRQLFP